MRLFGGGHSTSFYVSCFGTRTSAVAHIVAYFVPVSFFSDDQDKNSSTKSNSLCRRRETNGGRPIGDRFNGGKEKETRIGFKKWEPLSCFSLRGDLVRASQVVIEWGALVMSQRLPTPALDGTEVKGIHPSSSTLDSSSFDGSTRSIFLYDKSPLSIVLYHQIKLAFLDEKLGNISTHLGSRTKDKKKKERGGGCRKRITLRRIFLLLPRALVLACDLEWETTNRLVRDERRKKPVVILAEQPGQSVYTCLRLAMREERQLLQASCWLA